MIMNELEEALKTAARNIRWQAETIHQAHHWDEAGMWFDCDKGTCG